MNSVVSTQRPAMETGQAFILWACIIASIQLNMDIALMPNIAPAVSDSFKMSETDSGLLSSVYLVALAAFILAGGILGDHYGRKRMIMLGVAIEGIMALLASMAPSANVLLVVRALAGIGGALISSLSIGIINATFSTALRPHAMGVYFAVFALSAGASGMIFQIINDLMGWHATFALIFIISIVAFGILCFIPKGTIDPAHHIDWIEVVLTGIGLALLVAGVRIAGEAGGFYNPVVWLLSGIGLLALLALFFYSRHHPAPKLQVDLLKQPVVLAAIPLALFGFLTLSSVSFELNLYLQSLLQYAPSTAAFYLLPLTTAAFLVSLYAGQMIQHFSTSILALSAFTLMIAGIIVLTFLLGPTINFFALLIPLMLIGSGFVIMNNMRTHLIVGSALQQFSGAASAISSAIDNFGAILGISISAMLFGDFATHAYIHILTQEGSTSQHIASSTQVLKNLVHNSIIDADAIYEVHLRRVHFIGSGFVASYIQGLMLVFWIIIIVLISVAIGTFLLLRRSENNNQHRES